jgi:ribonuclease T2
MIVRLFVLLAACLVLAFGYLQSSAKAPQPGQFDYFVIALSWSPTYCASNNDNEQCRPERVFDFVVHGLWPQYRTGWPQDCATRENWVTEENIAAMLPIMPSKRLIIHEWKKHGACAGISQDNYFRAIRLLRGKIKTPARYITPNADVFTTPQQLVQDFVKTNIALTAEMISVQCSGSRGRARLDELRICLDKRGNFAACGSNEARQCNAAQLIMPRSRR